MVGSGGGGGGGGGDDLIPVGRLGAHRLVGFVGLGDGVVLGHVLGLVNCVVQHLVLRHVLWLVNSLVHGLVLSGGDVLGVVLRLRDVLGDQVDVG